jgi:hypothetical protein
MALTEWVRVNIFERKDCGRCQSLLLSRRGGEGKTGYASLVMHKHVDTRWKPSVVKDRGEYMVVEDMFERFTEWKVLLGAQRTITIKEIRQDPVEHKWNIPTIWCCNPDNDPRKWSQDIKEYIERMCIVVELSERLF